MKPPDTVIAVSYCFVLYLPFGTQWQVLFSMFIIERFLHPPDAKNKVETGGG